jgi:hypothetical protein
VATGKQRKNIYLPSEEAGYLREAAARWNVSEGEVVRRALRLLKSEQTDRDPVLAFIGSFSYPVKGKRRGARYVDDIYGQ